MSKTPVSSAGFGIAHNNPDELMPFESAKERLSKARDLGLGISLRDGIKVNDGRLVRAICGASILTASLSSDSDTVDDGVMGVCRCVP